MGRLAGKNFLITGGNSGIGPGRSSKLTHLRSKKLIQQMRQVRQRVRVEVGGVGQLIDRGCRSSPGRGPRVRARRPIARWPLDCAVRMVVVRCVPPPSEVPIL